MEQVETGHLCFYGLITINIIDGTYHFQQILDLLYIFSLIFDFSDFLDFLVYFFKPKSHLQNFVLKILLNQVNSALNFSALVLHDVAFR